MMNRTNFEHAAIAVVIQLVLWPFFGLFTAGCIAVALFVGREYSQGEYRLQAITKQSIASIMPWQLFRKDVWHLDCLLDVLFPLAACLLVFYIGGLYV